MSLGGGAHGIQDLLTIAVDNLDQRQHGRRGRRRQQRPRALHRRVARLGGARADRRRQHGRPLRRRPVTVGGHDLRRRRGDFATVDLRPRRRRSASSPAPAAGGLQRRVRRDCRGGSLAGKIALISRGVCAFSAQDPQRPGRPAPSRPSSSTTSAGDPTRWARAARRTSRPSRRTWSALARRPALDGRQRPDGDDRRRACPTSRSANGDIMAGFSSQGPTDVDFRVKPDVVAPGVNVLSLDPGERLRRAAVLRVLQRHLDGDAAPRRLGGGRPRPACRTGRPAEVAVGGRQHGRPRRAEGLRRTRLRSTTSTSSAPVARTWKARCRPWWRSIRSASASAPCPRAADSRARAA